MRPITNILLVLALICYLFLPFYDISFIGTVNGLKFTAGTISQALSLSNIILALLPFIAIFGAICLNCLKGRWWVLGTIACSRHCPYCRPLSHCFLSSSTKPSKKQLTTPLKTVAASCVRNSTAWRATCTAPIAPSSKHRPQRRRSRKTPLLSLPRRTRKTPRVSCQKIQVSKVLET